MSILEWFLSGQAETPQLLTTHHDPTLMVLSVLIAVAVSVMALQVAGLAQVARDRFTRHFALVSGALALGGGVWSMHFIGMLAFDVGTPVRYAPELTLLSLLPALLASWAALCLLARYNIPVTNLIAGGVIFGLGIGLMHYTGMAAMQMDAQLRLDPLGFVVSILVAVVMAMLALWVRFGLRDRGVSPGRTILLGGGIMGCAIASMHYTGMAAASFYGEPSPDYQHSFADQWPMAASIALLSVAMMVLAGAINGMIHYRQLSRRLQEQELQLGSLIHNIPGTVFRCLPEPTWPVLFISEAVEELTGWPVSHFVEDGHGIETIMHPDDADETYKQVMRALSTGRSFRSDYRIVDRSGREHWVAEYSTGVFDRVGRLRWIDGVLIDVSQRRQMEQALVEAKNRAERAVEAKSAFLANMSHEIRTPMNSIIGYAELMAESGLSEPQRDNLKQVDKSARALLRLLNDILEAARLERGAVELETEVFDLQALCIDALDLFRPEARRKGLALSLDWRLPGEQVTGDPFRLRQILLNLLGNAVKFTEQGTVTCCVGQHEQMIEISVVDTGIGIAQDRLAHIFEPFVQANASMGRRYGGTGLGTSIVRELVTLMDGTIDVHSTPGEGTRFVVRLPLPIATPDLNATGAGSGHIIEPAADVTKVETDSETMPAIDWASGEARWGDAEALRAALQRFLHRERNVTTDIARLLDRGVLKEARVLIDRIRGGAANLSLPELTEVATLLHLQLSEPRDGLRDRALLRAMDQALANAVQALQLRQQQAHNGQA